MKILLEDNIYILNDPQRIFNSDETSIFLSPKGGLILAGKGENFCDVSNSTDKENITILITVNVNREIAPPLAIFKYKRLPQTTVKSAPSECGTGISDSGWMT